MNYTKKIKASIENAFTKDLTPEEARNVGKCYLPVFRKVATTVGGKYRLDVGVAEDIASIATLYALAYMAEKGRLATVPKGEVQAMALLKGKRLALDWLRKLARSREELLADNPFADENGVQDCTPSVAKASVQTWRNEQFDAQWGHLVEKASKAVHAFLTENFTAKMSAIFWTRMMKRISTVETSRLFHVSEDNVGVICHRVMKEWRNSGKKYIMRAA